MTDEILKRANDLKIDMKHTIEILDLLNAEGLEISIATNIKGINYRRIWEGEHEECIEVKEALIRTFSKRLSEYIEEFNAL